MATLADKYRHRRRAYLVRIQVALVMALGFVLLAFQFQWHPAPPFSPPTSSDTFVPTIEAPVTIHSQPPTPPRPPAPIPIADDIDIDTPDLEYDASIQIEDALRASAPPIHTGTTEEEANAPVVFIAVEEMPQPIGGLQAIYKYVTYPEMARRAGIDGQVILRFVVDEQGHVVDPTILKSAHPLLDEAALKALQHVRFTPGRQRNKPVRVQFDLPVSFNLR